MTKATNYWRDKEELGLALPDTKMHYKVTTLKTVRGIESKL